MDDLAVKLGMDPVELRLKNDPSPIRQREYALGTERFGWKHKYRKPGGSPGVVKTGVGCAGAAWPAGGASHQTQGEAQINPDGSIEFRLGVQDIGTGTKTVIAVVAAELLGLKPEQITVKVGDTHFPPGPGSGGSTTCASVSPTVYDVCTKAPSCGFRAYRGRICGCRSCDRCRPRSCEGPQAANGPGFRLEASRSNGHRAARDNRCACPADFLRLKDSAL